jgi:recombinational DNA repair protein (RecF pathway)
VATVRDQAICIRQWDWSETSQTVSLLGRETGLVRAVAKGSKRENSRFSGGLEPLTRGEMIAIIKPSSEMGNLIAWDLQEVFPVLRGSLTAFYAGLYMAELVQSALTERDPHPALFDALLGGLRALPGGDRPAVVAFQWATLVEAGYMPELERDMVGGGELASARAYLFLPRLGGFTRDAGGEASAGGHRVRGETLGALRAVARGEPAGGQEVTDRVSRLLALYLREILGRDMPSMHAYFGRLTGRPDSPG